MSVPNPQTGYVTMSPSPASKPPKPVLLAFHGSGSNNIVHEVQLARLNRHLKDYFSIIQINAPFESPPGPGVLPMFEGCGPFKRWLPGSEKYSKEDMVAGKAGGDMHGDVEDLIRKNVEDVRGKGGKVVGVVGFSQGTRIVAGLLRAVQVLRQLSDKPLPSNHPLSYLDDLVFGLSVCGSYPPPLLPPSILQQLNSSQNPTIELLDQKIQIPTLHLLGKADEWMSVGEKLVQDHYEVGKGKSEVLECEMGHHYPVDPQETQKTLEWILKTWRETQGQSARP